MMICFFAFLTAILLLDPISALVRLPFNRSKFSLEMSSSKLVDPSYNLAIGTSFVTAALFGLKSPLVIPFVPLSGLLTVQTGRVRFSFDDEALEVLAKKKDDELTDSGENFAVGGKNRWKYDTFTSWNFIPNESFPLFMYFKETQTNGPEKEQFHLFPVIMNSQQLSTFMKEKVGVDKMK
jgi:hypothetical protein